MRLGGLLARFKASRSGAAPAPARIESAASNRRAQALEALARGTAHARAGERTAAETMLEQAVSLCHDLAPAHAALGRLQLETQRFEDAADSLQLAALYAPNDAVARSDLALAWARLDDADAAHEAIQRVIDLAPEAAEVWATCAIAGKAIGRLELAARCYAIAVERAPGSAQYAAQLGYVQYLRGDYDAARRSYGHALERDALHVAALHNLGLLELETGRPARALELFRRAVELDPSLPSRACVAHALRDLGRFEDACESYRQVLAQEPTFGDARINLAYALLMAGEFDAGWSEYDLRFEATDTPVRNFGLPLWRGEPLSDKRLLIHAEQGLGDEIMFASCLPEVIAHAGGVVLECSRRLEALFARSFPGVQVHGADKDTDPGWLRRYAPCDYQVPIGSLPRHYRRSTGAFPPRPAYLVADPARVAAARARICDSAKLNIGIAWRGGALRTRQWLRSIPLSLWLPLLECSKCRFVALQHGDHAAELSDVRSRIDTDLVDLSAVSADIDELAAVVCALDLVITVDNALGHLAGALGCPVWVLLPACPEWRYPRAGEAMPWYPTMRLYRQSGPGDGEEVLRQVARALRARMDGERGLTSP